MASVPIPNGIYQVGSTVYGPVAMADTDEWLYVSNDRTVNQGLNSKPVTTTVQALWEVNFGDGQWIEAGRCTFQGGIRSDPETGQLNTDYYATYIQMVPNRQIRCTITVAGSSVRLAGTVETGFGARLGK